MTVNIAYALSDQAIANELGQRLKSLRLRRNVTQADLARATDLSLNTIKSLESGKAKLATLIAVLRELDALDALQDFLTTQQISPLQLAKMRGKQRRRASRSRAGHGMDRGVDRGTNHGNEPDAE